MGVKVSDDIGHYFLSKKGLRQGDPLSAIIFNLAANVLAILIQRAKAHGKFRGVVPHLVEDGLSVLQSIVVSMIIQNSLIIEKVLSLLNTVGFP